MSRLRAHPRLATFAVLVMLQALVIIGFVVREERVRATGREIVLKAMPVDPRDLLRGDYVILGYEAQTLGTHLLHGPDVTVGERVYVTLERQDRYWVPTAYQAAASGKPSGAVYLTAIVGSRSSTGIRVDYPNLDRYYVPQGTGNLPKPPDAFVIVDGDGNARLARLEIDGVSWPPPKP